MEKASAMKAAEEAETKKVEIKEDGGRIQQDVKHDFESDETMSTEAAKIPLGDKKVGETEGKCADGSYNVGDVVKLIKMKHLKYKDCLATVTKTTENSKGEQQLSLKLNNGSEKDKVIVRGASQVTKHEEGQGSEVVSAAGVRPDNAAASVTGITVPEKEPDLLKVFGKSVPEIE